MLRAREDPEPVSKLTPISSLLPSPGPRGSSLEFDLRPSVCNV